MKLISYIFAAFLLLFSVSACQSGRQGGESPAGDTLTLTYAQLLTVVDYDGYSVASIKDPWNKGRTLHEYVLLPREGQIPEHLPKATVVRTPVSKAVIYTSVHSSLVQELGAEQQIGGVCDFQYIHVPYIIQGVKNGSIMDCGDAMSPDLERIIDLEPDAIMLSPFENSGGYGRVEELGVPIVECADYMETSALGRAEWMKFYGRLFDKAQEADSLFAEVDRSYQALKQLASETESYPEVVADMKTGSVWYVPGGQSTQGKLFADAHAQYPYADDTHSGSLALSFETVFDKCGEADVWIFRYNQPTPMTYRQLAADYAGNAEMKAYKQRHIFGCNTNASLFYEETPFHPDRLLSEYIQIFHPEIDLGGLRYYTPLSE